MLASIPALLDVANACAQPSRIGVARIAITRPRPGPPGTGPRARPRSGNRCPPAAGARRASPLDRTHATRCRSSSRPPTDLLAEARRLVSARDRCRARAMLGIPAAGSAHERTSPRGKGERRASQRGARLRRGHFRGVGGEASAGAHLRTGAGFRGQRVVCGPWPRTGRCSSTPSTRAGAPNPTSPDPPSVGAAVPGALRASGREGS